VQRCAPFGASELKMTIPHSSGSYDVVIIGAGINGAGIARDASMRGLKVLLIDKGDLASGTSSWSTRLIHGGLRYLEHFEFGLVRESLRERETLLRIAPHLVRPLQLVVPIYKDRSRGPVVIRAGLIVYDLLSFGKSLPRHRMFSRAKTLENLPGLKSDGLVGGALFYDCQVEFAERLVLENVLAARDEGAEILTYTKATKIDANGVEFIRKGSEKPEFVRAQVIINASGAWIDRVLSNTGEPGQRLIGGTKGSHIVVRSFSGAPTSAVYVEAESDGRPFFVIPWHNNYLIGTTDVRFENDPDEVRGESWEIDYLIKETNNIFPGAKLGRLDICYVYSGVRPLAFTNDADEQSITRRHFIREHGQLSNLLSIVGGKLTTYRSLSQECVDLVFKKIGKNSPPCRTHEVRLPGARSKSVGEPEEEMIRSWPSVVRDRLSSIYGTRISELAELCRDHSELAIPFTKNKEAIAAEVIYSFESEFASTLSDCLLRRTMIGLNCDLGAADAEAAARIAQTAFGWSEERVEEELSLYHRMVTRMSVPR
jgi:glycerol-3-phosphate dehydrogenase